MGLPMERAETYQATIPSCDANANPMSHWLSLPEMPNDFPNTTGMGSEIDDE